MPLGPTFAEDLIAAGLGGLPIGWNDDGQLWGLENLTEAQAAVLSSVISTHDPTLTTRPPSASDVRAEASRRMQALLGARDAGHLGMLITNGTREAVRLLRKGSANWTVDEAVRAAQLEQIDIAIEAIRAASNGMEATPPLDFRDDGRWP